MNRRQPHYRLTRLGRMLVVLAQAPIPPQPGERPFHHPTHLQGLKARHAFRPAHHHQAVRPPVQTQPGVDGLPGGEVVGQGPPGAALAGAVEQGVDDPTHIGRPGATARPGRRDERLDDCPLSVRQVTGIGFGCRLAFHTLFYATRPFWNRVLLHFPKGDSELPVDVRASCPAAEALTSRLDTARPRRFGRRRDRRVAGVIPAGGRRKRPKRNGPRSRRGSDAVRSNDRGKPSQRREWLVLISCQFFRPGRTTSAQSSLISTKAASPQLACSQRITYDYPGFPANTEHTL